MTGKAPTIEQEMAKFKGFSTNNGETVDPKDTVKGPGDDNLSAEERAAGIKIIDETPGAAAAAAAKAANEKGELTEAEKTAALDKARTVLKLEDDEELTPEEETAALAEALKEKGKTAGKGKNKDEDVRLRRANGRARAAEARAREAETRLSTLESRLAAVEGRGTLTADGKPAKAEDDKEPDPSKFELGELDPKYIRALARWEVRQELADASKTQQTKQLNSKQEAAAAEIAEKRAAFEEAGYDRFDDFKEVVLDTVRLPKSDPAAWPLSATIGQLILNSEFGADVAYALASDPKEAKRVDKLSDAEKQRWFFRQEAKFEAEKAPAAASGDEQDEDSGRETNPEKPVQRTATQAPPPPRRRNNGAGSTSAVSPATQDFAAFEAMARAPARRR
jgi:hypothetical protein